ncbi:M48 family metallopeptidase [Moheibacter sp.]|uniref:M48 family metallopeptidase n=1 Tax=Moheibacter sp. TaxID=1965316 RepID=UPI003C716FC6
MTERIKIGEVEIDVTFKDIKNLHLSVHPPIGRVTISSPEMYSLEKVKIYAATKLGWIKKEQRKFQAQNRERQRLYKNQESHYFFGDRYLLKLQQSSRNKVELNGKKLIIHSREPADIALSQKTLYAFYRKELRKYLDKRIQKYAAEMHLQIPSFKIRTMKTKWGSCTTDADRLWFNIELAKKPLDCIDYVVVHEMVHLLERHHNKRFVLLMDQYYPSWRTQKKILNELPL